MNFLILGNDKRQLCLAKQLKERKQQVILGEEYRNQPMEVILLPVAKSQIYQERISKYLREGHLVFGSSFTQEFKEYCGKNRIELTDYMRCASVSVRNAVNVAEGAIVEALKQGGPTIQGSRCLVAGYGVCGKKLSEKLLAWKAEVHILEKNQDKRAEAIADGCVCAETRLLQTKIESMDYIFNTIPEIIFKEREISCFRRETISIDLASLPGGFDQNMCGRAGIQVVRTPGLPGIYGADQAAGVLLEVIERKIGCEDRK